MATLLRLPLAKTVKAIAVMHDEQFFLLLLRGDHTLNEVKTAKLPFLNPFRFASDEEVERHMGCRPGYIGPVGMTKDIPIIADRAVAQMSDFVCGANAAGFHLTGVNWGRDLREPDYVFDIRNVVEGDPSPDGKGFLSICRGIEVGHIFQLRTKYSEAMKATFLDESGQPKVMEMGCYGIGVTRIVGAASEQNHDERGIIFPCAIAPFELAIAPVGYRKSQSVQDAANRLYKEFLATGLDVLMDDRDERPGVMFADIELIGIPHRVTIGERGLKEGVVEYQGRRDTAAVKVPLADIREYIRERRSA